MDLYPEPYTHPTYLNQRRCDFCYSISRHAYIKAHPHFWLCKYSSTNRRHNMRCTLIPASSISDLNNGYSHALPMCEHMGAGYKATHLQKFAPTKVVKCYSQCCDVRVGAGENVAAMPEERCHATEHTTLGVVAMLRALPPQMFAWRGCANVLRPK